MFCNIHSTGFATARKRRYCLGNIYTTGITGSTGAGQGLSSSSHFSWRANNIQAYKTLNHQHVKEIMQSLGQLQPGISDEGEQVELCSVARRLHTRNIHQLAARL